MVRNDRTPGAGASRALRMSAVAADVLGDTVQPARLQARNITQRFSVSASVAAVIAGHCYGISDNWRAAR